MFQFPTNGKAYPKLRLNRISAASSEFQFPTNGKPIQSLGVRGTLTLEKSFNSLRTGKPIQSISLSDEIESVIFCFNSLRTGKPIQSKLPRNTARVSPRRCFNSLRTGKPIQSITTLGACKRKKKVSIPYERESLSKAFLKGFGPR